MINTNIKTICSINDQNLDNNFVLIDSLKIIESVSFGIPTLEMKILCGKKFLYNIYDGAKIDIKFINQDLKIESDNFSFRIFNFDWIIALDERYTVTIVANKKIDNMFDSIFLSINGNSNLVFNSIANKCNLTFIGDITNDKQTWICPGKSLFDWSFDVSNHSYYDENSCFSHCITKNDRLIFSNVNKKLKKEADFILNDSIKKQKKDKKDLFYNQFKPKSRSGFFNNFSGYKRKDISFDVTTGSFNEISTDSIEKNFDKLFLNKDLNKIKSYDNCPLDCGNTHKNYHIAKNQNIRFKSLYSIGIEIGLFDFNYDIKLLDSVLLLITSEESLNKQYSGKYIIDKISIVKENGRFCQYISIVRNGINLESDIKDINLV